ncbi:MAG: OmpA family protein, partial [Pseudomonadales bacterium]
SNSAPQPWWPGGLLPVLGLIVLYLVGAFLIAPQLEQQTLDAVVAQLESNDYADVGVSASGQHIEITIPASTDATSQRRIEASARGSRCQTWAGSLGCPVTVVSADAGTDADPAGTATTSQPQPPQQPRHHDLVMTRVGDRVILRGDVPSNERRGSLLAAARAQFNEVDDALNVTGAAARPADQFAGASALELLSNMTRGQVIWAQGVLGASGLVDPEREAAVRIGFAELASTVTTGSLNLRVARAADLCNQSFASALARGTITFASGAATIDSSSDKLLKRLAQLARQCSGSLTVEGHTDNVGQVSFNNRLSLARAEAVVAALTELKVPATRLRARGYGPSQPVADNTTASGRAQNRRIVIRTTEG